MVWCVSDSITDGQFPFVRDLLNTTLDSHLIPINGGDTGEGQTCASVWAQDFARWDVVSYKFVSPMHAHLLHSVVIVGASDDDPSLSIGKHIET
jgi:hypothetical protein